MIETALSHSIELVVNPAGHHWQVQVKTHSGDLLATGQASMLPTAVLEALKAAHGRVVK